MYVLLYDYYNGDKPTIYGNRDTIVYGSYINTYL